MTESPLITGLNPAIDPSRQALGGAAEEIELVQRVAAGDEKAFDQLYQKFSPAVFNYLLRLVNEQPAAEDILQEVFVAVWQSAGKFRAQSQVKTWIFRIAHHQAVSWLRRMRHDLPDEKLEQVAAGFTPEQEFFKGWETTDIFALLDQLTPKHRAVVELAFVHELSYQEIAEVLECPVGTVKSRMSYALKRLTGLLKPDPTKLKDPI
jgi:RNA polymerase sigma-70 factor (ECF subfamily)